MAARLYLIQPRSNATPDGSAHRTPNLMPCDADAVGMVMPPTLALVALSEIPISQTRRAGRPSSPRYIERLIRSQPVVAYGERTDGTIRKPDRRLSGAFSPCPSR